MTTNYATESATVITASSSDPAFPSSNLKHPFRSKRWRSTDPDSENVVFDMITTEEIDSVVILWPKEDGIRLSDTAVVKIQANATDSWGSPAVDQTLTIDNTYMVASHYFSTDQSYRYWRVVIEDVGNPYGYVELGMVWLGKSLSIQNAQNGFKFVLEDGSKSSSNDFGHVYVDEYPTLAGLSLSYKFMDYDEVQILENAFRENGKRNPVIIALDPDDDVFSKDHFMIYGLMQKGISLEHVNYNILNVDGITISELA
jgi:hypothetical protein